MTTFVATRTGRTALNVDHIAEWHVSLDGGRWYLNALYDSAPTDSKFPGARVQGWLHVCEVPRHLIASDDLPADIIQILNWLFEEAGVLVGA